jgi:gamma-glutamylaminecyclotransferase
VTPIFVYGSLLSGLQNHRLLAGAPLVEAFTEAAFSLFDLGPFPAMVDGGASVIRGEVYTVDDETLSRLDRLEGHPRFYRRTPITLADGGRVETYLLPASEVVRSTLVPSGDWRTHYEEKRRR